MDAVEIIKKNNMRLTKQREIMLEELKKVKTHPDAKQVYEIVRKKIPNISFGTVYRNLRVLKELGLVLELDYGVSRYDGDTSEHYHFTCEKCRKVLDIFEKLKFKIKTRHKIKSFRLELFGVCNDCLKNNY